MKLINGIITSLIGQLGMIAVALALTLVGTMAVKEYGRVRDDQNKANAVSDCMQVSSYTFTDTDSGVVTVEPIERTYNECLKIAGF